MLTAAGFSEAITFGFIEAKAAELFLSGDTRPQSQTPAAATPLDRLVRIANPLSAKFDTLRLSLLPGLVDAVAHNRRHGRRDVRLFEIGTRFAPDGETRGGGVRVDRQRRRRALVGRRARGRLLRRQGGRRAPVRRRSACRCGSNRAAKPFLVAGQAASILVADGAEKGTEVGIAGQVAPAIADARGLPRQDRVFVAELNLDVLWRAHGRPPVRRGARRCRAIRRSSAICRSSSPIPCLPRSFVAPFWRPAATCRRRSSRRASSIAIRARAFRDGAVSLSIRLTFQAADRTLTDAEVQKSVEAILAALVEQHAAVQRITESVNW